MNTKIALIVVVLILAVLGVYYWGGDKNGTEQGQQVINNSTGMIVGKNALNVNEQRVGTTMSVSFVVLEKKGYVVVHEITDGKPGKIIGASALLPLGQSNNIAITLQASLKDGMSYIAMLHIDNDDGVFNATSDVPARNDADVIMMEFQANANAQPDGGVSI